MGMETVLAVYDMPHRWSSRRADAHMSRAPAAILRFTADGKLGTLEFHAHQPQLAALGPIPMSKWMARTGIFAGYVASFPFALIVIRFTDTSHTAIYRDSLAPRMAANINGHMQYMATNGSVRTPSSAMSQHIAI
jgi:hypothetical protein